MLNLLRKIVLVIGIFACSETAFTQVLGIPLYSWDFNSGLPSGWTNSNANNSSTGVWEYRGPNTVPNNTITSRGSCAGGSQQFTSITQSNGYMIFDSNYWDDPGTVCGGGFGTGPAPAPHNSWLISNSFSLTGVTGAVVTFQQQWRNNSAILKVQYSINNGSTWVDMITQQGTFPTAAAEWKSANFPAGAIGQTNVRLRFLFTGTYYSWCIDDITVYKPSVNNLSISNSRYTTFGNTTPTPPNDFHDLPYDMYPIPMASVVPFKFSAKANNIGSASQTNVNLNVKVLNSVNTALFNQTTTNTTVAAGASPTLTITPTYTPPGTAGYYRITYQLNQTQTDEIPLNNRDTLDFKMHPFQYARDEGAVEDVFNPSAMYNGQVYQVGNIFEARTTSLQCKSIVVAVGPGTNVGTVIQGKIFKNSFLQEVAQTVTYTVNAWDINNIGQEKLITLNLTTPLNLQVDSLYFVMVGNTEGTMPLRIGRAGDAIPETSLVRYPQNNGLAYMSKMPIVRMNLFTPSQIPGCTNPLAINYLSSATIDDASCDIPGCIYPTSSNYNANATWYDGSCIIPGCTNPLATNYNPNATVNDGSCIIPGCTDPAASNYNPQATVSNGSCIFLGCTDPSAANYNPQANQNNGTCIYPGCTDPIAANYNPQANQNNGSCIYPGCTDPIAANYNPQANQNNGSCIYPGCTDPAASNYNPQANLNNGSCIYLGCTDPTAANYNPQANQNNGTCIYPGCTDPTASNFNPQANQNNGTCIYPGCTDVAAANYNPQANQNNGSCIYPGCTNPLAINYNAQANQDNGTCIIVGCTNPLAINYNSQANQDNGSCIIPGCTDTNAANYNSQANQNNGTCIYPGCTDPSAINYNSQANQNNGSCIYPGCTDPLADNFNPQANEDNGTCIYPGCTDSAADNFNPQANQEDGSCIYFGCTDADANNFDPEANTNDYSCIYNNPTLQAEEAQICLNTNAVFVNQTAFNADNICLIDFGDGTEELGCQNFYYHDYSSAGNYTVTLFYTQGDTTITATASITVNPNPVQPIITNTSNLFAETTGNIIGYQWILNSSQIPYEDSVFDYFTFNQSSNGNGYYQVQVTNEFGCRSISDSILIIIPDLNFSNGFGCAPLYTEFTNTTGYDGNMNCYLQVNADEAFIPFNEPISYTYEVSGSFEPIMYCTANGFEYYTNETWNIEVFPIPNTPVLSNSNNQVSILNANNNIIDWYLDGAILNTNNNPTSISTYFNNAYQNGIFSATLTNSYGCVSELGSVFVLQSAAELNNATGCLPLTVAVTNTTDYAPNVTCTLNIDGNTFDLPIGETLELNLPNSGVYSGELTCSQGNTYSTITTNDIVVYALPPTPILTAEFGNVTATNASGNSIEWFLDGTLLNSTSNPLSTLINGIYQSGTYSAIYSNSFGCTSQIGVITTIQPTMQLSSTAVCPGEQITFLNTTDPIQGMSCVFIPYLNGPNYNLDPYESIVLDLDYSGSFNSQLICTAQAVIGSNNYSYTVTNIPNTPQITESNNTLTAYNTSANDQLQWYYNGNAIGNTNPISVLNGEIYQDGFYYVTVVNSSGCSNQSDSVLILHPSFTQSESQICPNDSVTFTNTTAIIEGLTCSLNDGLGNNYNFDETLTIYYPTNGYFYPEISCSLAGNTFSDVGLPILVFSPPDAPQLLAQFGAIICNNCNGLPTDYYLNNEYLVTSNFNISTYINGSYLNGYYSAQLVNSQGCLSPLSDSVLLIHPLYSTSAHGGCAPLEITFTNTTENISGLNCELSVNPQLSNVSLPVGESFSYQYNLPDYYETSLVCTLNNQNFYSLTDIISVNGNTVPDLVQIGDTVSCLNCLIESNTTWLVDGTNTISGVSSVDTLAGFFYNVTYINENGCVGENFIQITAISEENNQSLLQIFPNPTTNQTWIQTQANSELEVRSITGNLLFKTQILSSIYSLDTSSLPNGSYVISIKNNNNVQIGTLFVMH